MSSDDELGSLLDSPHAGPQSPGPFSFFLTGRAALTPFGVVGESNLHSQSGSGRDTGKHERGKRFRTYPGPGRSPKESDSVRKALMRSIYSRMPAPKPFVFRNREDKISSEACRMSSSSVP